jgi:hypothetical protein
LLGFGLGGEGEGEEEDEGCFVHIVFYGMGGIGG